jgi:hypothetical protein
VSLPTALVGAALLYVAVKNGKHTTVRPVLDARPSPQV